MQGFGQAVLKRAVDSWIRYLLRLAAFFLSSMIRAAAKTSVNNFLGKEANIFNPSYYIKIDGTVLNLDQIAIAMIYPP